MRRYCRNCGHEITDDDKFCHNCGKRIDKSERFTDAGIQAERNSAARTTAGKPGAASSNRSENSVKYVQVDTRTGKIVKNSNAKSSSDSMMQGLTIAFVAIAVVIVMAAGSMFISGHMKENITAGSDAESDSAVDVSSAEPTQDNSISSEEEVNTVPTELQADYLKSRIKGKWSANLPYKSMSLPVTFTFDDAGNCSCVIKALFITKQFDGNYTINDGGQCTVTLSGLDEYMSEGNSIAGSMQFISDDEVNFTVGNNKLILNRME